MKLIEQNIGIDGRKEGKYILYNMDVSRYINVSIYNQLILNQWEDIILNVINTQSMRRRNAMDAMDIQAAIENRSNRYSMKDRRE